MSSVFITGVSSGIGHALAEDPGQAAGPLIDAIGRLPGLVESGEYADVRRLPKE